MTRTEWEQQAEQHRQTADEAQRAGDEERAEFYERKARLAEAMVPYGTDDDTEERAHRQ